MDNGTYGLWPHVMWIFSKAPMLPTAFGSDAQSLAHEASFGWGDPQKKKTGCLTFFQDFLWGFYDLEQDVS